MVAEYFRGQVGKCGNSTNRIALDSENLESTILNRGIILDPPRMNSFTKQTQSQILFTFDGNKAYYIILAYIGMLFAPAAGQIQNSWITSQSACLKIRSGR